MTSPARAHFIKHSVAAAAAKAAADNSLRPDATQYELHLAQLTEHRRRLKQIQSIERKVEFKRQILPEYNAYIQGVLEGGSDAQDDVLTTLLVWHIDVGDFDGALTIGAYVLQHGLQLPDQYQRDAATVIAEEIAEHTLVDLGKPDATASDALVQQLVQAADLVKGRDMPDEVQAKLHKAIGYALRDTAPEAALAELGRALELNPNVGVKKDIERLQRAINKDTAAATKAGA